MVLSKAGAQIPVTPFVEVVGKGAKIAPKQIGVTGLKIAESGFTSIVKFTGFEAH